MSINTYLVACMVLLWASRLGGYLFSRVLLTGQDHRFDGMRESFLKFGGFWFFQGISIWIILLPTMLFLLRRPDKISLYSYIGLAVFLVGFFIESIADMQKFAFKQNPSYAGKWIETGLWKYSRHPNYFGEVLVWLGIWIYTLPVFTSSWLQLGVSVISPVYITLLITLISGIPILEASADKRWGENKAYKSYKARTSSFIPWFPKSKNGSS